MKESTWVKLGIVAGILCINLGFWLVGLFIMALVIRDIIVLDLD